MNKKILKIRLKPDGTWENVYENEFVEMTPELLASLYKPKVMDKSYKTESETLRLERDKLETMRLDLIDSAVEKTDLSMAKAVIDHIRKLP